jgi:hypothetical protein
VEGGWTGYQAQYQQSERLEQGHKLTHDIAVACNLSCETLHRTRDLIDLTVEPLSQCQKYFMRIPTRLKTTTPDLTREHRSKKK